MEDKEIKEKEARIEKEIANWATGQPEEKAKDETQAAKDIDAWRGK